jgi:hypothetical protein
MTDTFITQDRVYRVRTDGTYVYLYPKGATIPMSRAIELGLVKPEAPTVKKMPAAQVKDKKQTTPKTKS